MTTLKLEVLKNWAEETRKGIGRKKKEFRGGNEKVEKHYVPITKSKKETFSFEVINSNPKREINLILG